MSVLKDQPCSDLPAGSSDVNSYVTSEATMPHAAKWLPVENLGKGRFILPT